MRTAHAGSGCEKLSEGCPGIDTERRNPHHSLQPQLWGGCHPIGQRFELP
jgi:hypothetical protein